MSSNFSPSKYQEDILAWVIKGQGDGIVGAVPGSGKTTTLVEIAKILPAGQTALVCSFGKKIAEELGKKMPKDRVKSSTINSFGFTVLGKNMLWSTLDRVKYTGASGIVATLLDSYYPDLEKEQRDELKGAANKLVDKSRLTLTGPTTKQGIEELSRAFDPEQPDTAIRRKMRDEYVEQLLQLTYEYSISQKDLKKTARVVIDALLEGIRMATGKSKGAKNTTDFTDQVWLPIILRLPAPQYDWVMVDEAQDLNRCQLNLIVKARKPGTGRMLFVGDRHQAIYGFAGADSASMDSIQKKLGCTELPLSICYRCPKSHVDLAASIYEGIESHPKAVPGELSFGVKEDWAIINALPTADTEHGYQDIFICRNTAPLVSLAYRLLRSGKPAKVMGKSIGEGLASFTDRVRRWGNKNNLKGWGNFNEALTGFIAEKCAEARESLKEGIREAAIEDLNDKAETLQVLWATKKCNSYIEFKDFIVSLFTDTGDQTIWLATIHKSKGLEARRVFIVEPQLMPSKMARTPDAQIQEANIMYISYTRAKQALYILESRPKGEDNNLSV